MKPTVNFCPAVHFSWNFAIVLLVPVFGPFVSSNVELAIYFLL